ncbi:MAG: GNAT family N-acetyltransferase [Betaproteobacteria bacterium]|nr:GNAT family N-acetyltransferase [Betaproteobacteria bacterium]
MAAVRYARTCDGVDWAVLTHDLAADRFDNGRTPAELERSFRASREVVFAFAGDRVIGKARALSDGVCNAYVVDLWTHSAHRRRGIGHALLDLLCARLPGQHVCLFTDDAPAFYAACGFAARGTAFERVVGAWLDRG